MDSRALPAIALALGSVACGKHTFLAVAFLATPAVPNPVAGLPDIPSQTVLTTWIGTIDTTNPTKIDQSKIEMVSGALGTVAFHSGAGSDHDLPLAERGSGMYTLESGSEPRLTFEPGVHYTVVMLAGKEPREAFGAKLVPAPSAHITEFAGAKLKPHAIASDFTVTRDDPVGKDGRFLPAFVTVARIDPQNPTAAPQVTYTTVPSDGTSLLKFALSDEPHRKGSYVVPSSKAFTSPGFYVVALLVLKYGLVSENAFLGSTAVSGSGDAGILDVK